jgi:transcriptional regulator with XRE-family HTH domain
MDKNNWHTQLKNEVLKDGEARAEYEAFKLQLELAYKLRKARQEKHLTQEDVAKKMDTNKTVIARLEAAGGKNKHSPSIITLIKFADALGCDIKFILTPRTKAKPSKYLRRRCSAC